MFTNLTQNIKKAIKTLRGQGQITETNVSSTSKEIRKVLIQADVEYKVAKQVTESIREKAIGQNVLLDVSPGQLFTKIVRDQLAELMGATSVDINLSPNPSIILMVGLQGAGKTTLSVKLANYIKKKKHKDPLLVACDVYRPAAIEQLKILANSIETEVYSEENNKDVISIAQNALKHAKSVNKQVIIVDTAGRLAIDNVMMDEIISLKKALNPSETLFVVDAMIGQDAVKVAKSFNDNVNFDGVVLTKLDGDARGGCALSITTVVQKPIKFIGTGEKVEDFSVFHPDRMANRILDMADVISFVEKIEETYDEQQEKLLQQKIKKKQLDLNDLLSQISAIQKLGTVKELIALIPGLNKPNQKIDENLLHKYKAIIFSMTPYERKNPDKITKSRGNKIAIGSGTTLEEVKELILKFIAMRTFMHDNAAKKRFTKHKK